MRSAIYNLLLALALLSLAARADEMSMEELTNLEPVTVTATQHKEQHPTRSEERDQPSYGEWAGINWPSSSTRGEVPPSETLDLH